MLDAANDKHAIRIAAYWRKLGYDVDVRMRVVEQPGPAPNTTDRYYAVRSNLKNGLPLRYSGDLAWRDA